MNKQVLQQYEYHVWANKRICEHLKQLPEEAAHQEMTSVFATIYDALVHMYVIDSGWLSLMSGGGVSDFSAEFIEELKASVDRLTEETRGKSIDELDTMLTGLAARFRAFINRHDDLEAICPYGAYSAPYAEFIQHVVYHGTYHRGNITTMLRQIGHQGIPTDYALYIYTKNQ